MLEKVVNGVYITGGIMLVMIVIMAMSSCGSNKQCNNKFINENRNW